MSRIAIALQLLVFLATSPSRAIASPTEDTPRHDPRATHAAKADTVADGAPVDLAALRAQYLQLRNKLFRSRARAAAVGDALYSTRLTIRLRWTQPRSYAVRRATIRLDGANVYDDAQGTIAHDDAPRFIGFIAPGRHVITVRLEAESKDDDRFATTVESSFALDAPAGKQVTATIAARDDGDIGYAWRTHERGTYRLRLDATIRATKRPVTTGHAR